MALTIRSSSFSDQGSIPTRFTHDGDDISPELSWSGVPQNAKSLALIVDDPDAPRGTFVHWILYDIPTTTNGLAEGLRADTLPKGTAAGMNDAGTTGYVGPAPPSGRHRYFFKLYALDNVITGLRSPTKQQLEEAMKGHVLAEAQLVGTYERGARRVA
jgi:Raf kinase inhibitor-like YbhB/YbcL family protein